MATPAWIQWIVSDLSGLFSGGSKAAVADTVVDVPPPVRKSDDERKALLASTIADRLVKARGVGVESQSDFQAVLADGHRVNHLLHLILTLLTLGLWAIIWIVLALAGGERRKMVQVDEWGNVLETWL